MKYRVTILLLLIICSIKFSGAFHITNQPTIKGSFECLPSEILALILEKVIQQHNTESNETIANSLRCVNRFFYNACMTSILQYYKIPEPFMLLKAVENNAYKTANWLLQRNINSDINYKHGLDRTVLHYAVLLHGNDGYNLIQLLLANGANVNALNTHKNTPLHYAIEHGKDNSNTVNNDAVISLLIKNGADLAIKNVEGRDVLHLAYYLNNDPFRRRSHRYVELLAPHYSFWQRFTHKYLY